MATLRADVGAAGGCNLSAAQTGNGQSTNTLDRGRDRGACLLKVTTAVGATPTVDIAIEGSADGVSWLNVAYALATTPETPAVANVVIAVATTNYYVLRPGQPWRYLRLTYSANVNVTITADVMDAAR